MSTRQNFINQYRQNQNQQEENSGIGALVAGAALSLSPHVYKILKKYVASNPDKYSSVFDLLKKSYGNIASKINVGGKVIDTAQIGTSGANTPSFGTEAEAFGGPNGFSNMPTQSVGTGFAPSSPSLGGSSFTPPSGASGGAAGRPFGMGGGPGAAPTGNLGALGKLTSGINAAAPGAIYATAAMTAANALRSLMTGPSSSEMFANQLNYNQSVGSSGKPWEYTGTPDGFNANRTGWDLRQGGPGAWKLAHHVTSRGGRVANAQEAQEYDVYQHGGKDFVLLGENNPMAKEMGLSTDGKRVGVALNPYGKAQAAYRNRMLDKAGENRGGK